MKVLGLAKLGLVVGAMSILSGCVTSGASLTKDENGNEIVVEPVKNYSKPKPPMFGKDSPEGYKSGLQFLQVKGTRTAPSPIAINGGSVKLNITETEQVASAQPKLSMKSLSLSAEQMLNQSGVSVNQDNGENNVKVTLLYHGMMDVDTIKSNSRNVNDLTSTMSLGERVATSVLLGLFDSSSGGVKKARASVFKIESDNANVMVKRL